MAENYVLLNRVELNTSAASVTFSNIPQTGYTDLKIVASTRVTDAGEGSNPPISRGEITFNGSGGNYTVKMLYGLPNQSPSANSAGGGPGSRSFYAGSSVSSLGTANTFSSFEIYIPNYTSSSAKLISIDDVTENNATATTLDFTTILWDGTAAITSIKLNPYNLGSFAQYSTFSLYGVASVGATPVTAPKAAGGNIIANDGTYWYHAFLSSGTFTPQTSLSADVLVIAGGGGGGGDIPGGAGAGGILYAAAKSLTATSYTCTIGAGGTNGVQGGTDPGTDGTDSFFDVLRAFGGARGVLTGSANGGNGSGGSYGTYTGGTSTQTSNNGGIGYGNSGGNSNAQNFASAGGGGAGSAGSANSGTVGGAGGSGLNTWSSWASATNTGVSGFFAGGGGGGGSGGGGAAGSGGGGAGAGRSTGSPAGSGVRNTGGGGGSAAGGNPVGVGGSGGSGIVIVRYAI